MFQCSMAARFFLFCLKRVCLSIFSGQIAREIRVHCHVFVATFYRDHSQCCYSVGEYGRSQLKEILKKIYLH